MKAKLSPSLIRFVTGHLSIHVAASCGDGLTTLARGLGARVDPGDTGCLRVLLSRAQSAGLVDAIAGGHGIAAVFNEPESHRTVQLKAPVAEAVEADDDDLAMHAPYVRAMATRLSVFGTPEPYVHALLACAPDDLVVVRFAPHEVFGQTPGPGAGAPIAADGPAP